MLDRPPQSAFDGPVVDPIKEDNIGSYQETWVFEKEEPHEKMARIRSEGNGCYACMYSIVTSVSFNFFIFMLIIGNTVTLAAYTYDQSDLKA